MLCNVVAKAHVAAILLKFHIRTVVVASVVFGRHGARKLARAHLVRCLGHQRSVAAAANIQVCTNAVFFHRARNNADDAAHCVAAVQNRCRAAKHLNTFGHHCLITIRNGVAENALILRMAVDEYQHVGVGAAADTADIDCARAAAANAVAHHGTACHKESGNLLHHCRQNRLMVLLNKFLLSDNRYGHRQMPDVHFVASAGNHHFLNVYGVGLTE